jgi:site-specific recombinase XerD
MAKSAASATAPTTENRTVTPRRRKNVELRPREYLTEKEVERLIDAARKHSRYGHRDASMILIAFRHGLRASELCSLRWDQVELDRGRIHVRRAKGGIDNVHPLGGTEIRALRQIRRENPDARYVFITERGGAMSAGGFLKSLGRIGKAAKFTFPVHPHMLRHATGFKLAGDGVDTRALQHFLGHANIQHTVRYTEMQPDRFKDFWRD